MRVLSEEERLNLTEYDERGYIEVVSDIGELFGYVGKVDYNSCTFELVFTSEKVGRYINDERMMYDVSFICAYCMCSTVEIDCAYSLRVHYAYGF